jgi:hypothetical protein
MHCIWLLYGTNSTLQSVVKEGSGRELVTVPHGEGPAAPTSAGHTCCSVCAQSWSPWSWDCAAAWCPPATGSTPPEAPEDATLTPSSHPGSTRPGLCWTPSWGPCHPLPALTQNLSFFSGGDFLSQPEHTTCPPSMARAQQDKGEAWRARSSGPGPPGRAHAHSTCPPPRPRAGRDLPPTPTPTAGAHMPRWEDPETPSCTPQDFAQNVKFNYFQHPSSSLIIGTHTEK